MKARKQSEQTIKRNLAALRKIIDAASSDTILKRTAYAMEQAITWATQETDWSYDMPSLARELASFLRDDLARKA